jgi:hypothetical protein
VGTDSVNDFPPDLLQSVRAEIVAALREPDECSNSPSCVFSAVAAKMACVLEMVELCAFVQNNEVTSQLLVAALDRKASRQGTEKVDPKHPLESIFAMTDGNGNTVLHLLMDSLGKTYRPAPVRIFGGPNGQSQPVAKSIQYDPMGIIDTVEKATSKQEMGALWRAVNKEGMSPYKSLLDNPGHSDAQRKEFQETIKNKIFNSLSDIADLKRALYGTRGTNPFLGGIDTLHSSD